jgi:putative peptide zinc metalloprotease protein
MAVLPGAPTGRDDTLSSRPAASAPAAPTRADGVELIGEMVGSGYREPPSLARRGDGQTIQLTPLLYLLLTAIDGRRDYDDVAEKVSAAYGRTVTADNVRTLVDRQLRPMGLVTRPDGSQPEVKKSNPLLALRFKYAVSDPDRTRRLTSPFARLFHPVLVVLVLAAFLGVCWWVLMEKGLASATYEAFDKPGLLLLVVAVTILSAGFHEFGHAAAARRGGATPGVMGAGVYLVWPAFYTDVTDSYRLGRGGRVRTDLGGLYFNAIVAVAIAGVWWATGYDALLLVVATQILQMIRQLTPLVRFDGYHVLADLTGVPDLFHRIKPTLLGVLPWRWRHPDTTVLKPWARTVVTGWVLVVVPVLAFSLFTMVLALPRIVGTAWASAGKQTTLMDRAWGDADFLEAAARLVAVVAVAFPILAIAVILFRLGRSVTRSAWKRTAGRPVRRGVAGLAAAAIVAGLAYAWWPHPGTYRPVQPFEGGTLVQAATAVRTAARPAPSGLSEGQYGRLVTAWADGDARPTPEDPQLALVLIPRGTDTGTSGAGQPAGGGAGDGTSTQPWVFPFDKPLEPGSGDNQAMAVNTADNTIRYDVAFALIWVEDDSPALNKNEAYAFASCSSCAAVAVGFQIVLVTGDNHVAVPQNISAAVNYDCVNCLTYALATQLFVTLDGPLSDAGMQEIAALWQEIAAFGADITSVPLSEIRTRLTEYEQQILAVIEKEQGPLGPDDPSAPAGTSPTDGSSTGSVEGADGSEAVTPADGPTAGASPDAGTSPDGSTDTGGSGSTTGAPDGQPTGDGTSDGTAGTTTSPQSDPTVGESDGAATP